MSFTVVKLEDEPIVLTHVVGELNATVYFNITLKAADLIENIPGTIYRISDVTNARIALLDMVDMVVQVLKGWPGTVSDPRVVSLVVARGGNAALAANHLANFAPQSMRVHCFSCLADALAYARADHLRARGNDQGGRVGRGHRPRGGPAEARSGFRV